MSDLTASGKKRRWYQNLRDAYTMTARVYSWLPWVLLAITVVGIAAFVVLGIVTGHWIYWPVLGIPFVILIDLVVLTTLARRAMYRLLEGHVGAAYQVMSQVKRGWIIEDQPVAMNQNQDVVWRAIGSCGVVLVSEGPSSRVNKMLHDEERKCKRAIGNCPVHLIQVGTEEGQVRVAKLLRTMNKLKKTLSRDEVPAVANRLQALQRKNMPIPKGVDPARIKLNRRALRGR